MPVRRMTPVESQREVVSLLREMANAIERWEVNHASIEYLPRLNRTTVVVDWNLPVKKAKVKAKKKARRR